MTIRKKHIRYSKNRATAVLAHKVKTKAKPNPWHKTDNPDKQLKLYNEHIAEYTKLYLFQSKLHLKLIKSIYKTLFKQAGITKQELEVNVIPQKKLRKLDELKAQYNKVVQESKQRIDLYLLETHKQITD